MLSDRPYMRDSYGRSSTPVLTWILCALVAGFLLQVVFQRALNSPHLADFTKLTVDGLTSGKVWTLLTYPLLHGNVLHLVFNLLMIYFLGRELVPLMGDRRLAWFTVGAVLMGGLAWAGVHVWKGDGGIVGSSAIACAYLILFACLNPNRDMTILLFFVLPVTVKPKYLALILAAVDVIGLVSGEIPGGQFDTGIAHSAHIGGMLAGLFYFRFVHQREWLTPDSRPEIELPRWFKKSQPKNTAETPGYKVNLTSRETLKAEVDRILDKINSEGFGALTPEEKHLLDEAKDLLSRR